MNQDSMLRSIIDGLLAEHRADRQPVLPEDGRAPLQEWLEQLLVNRKLLDDHICFLTWLQRPNLVMEAQCPC